MEGELLILLTFLKMASFEAIFLRENKRILTTE
jgi:hypothetical protein